MNVVYCPSAATGSIIDLDENEFHHLQVLRAREGEALQVFDGAGALYQARLLSIGKKAATIQVKELIKKETTSASSLHIAIAPTKNIERVEWFLEKATEIGISMITPVICRRSERRELRADRLEKVILSAAKQSLHWQLPVLAPVCAFKAFVEAHKDSNDKKFIAYCEEKTLHLKDRFAAGEKIIVLIGPEGDFTEEEVQMASAAGFEAVSLGSSRLRTETAALMVAAVFNLANEA